MKELKTIVVCGSEDIFSSSIECILTAEENWRVITVSIREGWKVLNHKLATLCPDIVIIPEDPFNKITDSVLYLLQNYPVFKVIVINLENNMMDVYSKQNTLLEGISGLIQEIED
ncbi:MAG: hypothetical protein KC441_14680 [Anaerolineales bacterium]|nr:hypothetical protein [Anaerolineales bacterium]